MEKLIQQLKDQWEENPLQTIVVGVTVAAAVSTIAERVASARSKSAYARRFG